MSNNFIILVLLSLTITLSCVPRKKLMYLQEDKGEIYTEYAMQEQEYLIKPKDVLAVNIFSLTPGQFDIFGGGEDGSGSQVNTFEVDTAGFVELPAIGEIGVSGLTIDQAEDKIKLLLQDYLKSPLVRITLQTPFEFTILGEVNGPGHYTTVGEKLSIFEAIGMAGDLSPFANRKQVKVVRRQVDGTTDIKEINLLNASILGKEDYYLKSNDLVLVDPLAARSVRENQLFFLTTTVGILSSLAFFLFRL